MRPEFQPHQLPDHHALLPAQPLVNPTPPGVITAPRVYIVAPVEDPRGKKRPSDEDTPDSQEPALKRKRTEVVAAPVDPDQQKMIDAILEGNTERVTALIRNSRKLLNGYLPKLGGMTPLCLAAKCGQRDIVEKLLIMGASLDFPARDGRTPLMIAAFYGHTNVVDLLCSLGANLNNVNEYTGLDALSYAINGRQLEACKLLIGRGIHIQRALWIPMPGEENKLASHTPIRLAIAADFSDLIAWYLDVTQQSVDGYEASTNSTMLNCAVAAGSRAVIRLLVERGASLHLLPYLSSDGKSLSTVWEVAHHFHRIDIIEYLLSLGCRPNLNDLGVPSFSMKTGFGVATDLCMHSVQFTGPQAAADGLFLDAVRQHPEKAILELALRACSLNELDILSAAESWSRKGLLWSLVALEPNAKFRSCANLLGTSKSFYRLLERRQGATRAQFMQILIEHLSDAICAPDVPTRFSNYKLTSETAQKMNQIALAQREILLQGIGHMRARFERYLVTLPDICINVYISLSRKVNSPDLYRTMTIDWGLYDPIARAVLRLVEEAFATLPLMRNKLPLAEQVNLPEPADLRNVMVDMLEAWDKVPEIVEAIKQCQSAEEMEVVSDLLFQQWRLFGEAFGVTKPRAVMFGPHRPEVVEPGRN